MQYRRITAPGGTFFFTLVTFKRRMIFADEQAVALLREAFHSVQLNHPFKIEAAVILPDHLHMLWHLPEGDSDYSTRWRLIKSHFTHQWGGTKDIPNTPSRQLKGEQAAACGIHPLQPGEAWIGWIACGMEILQLSHLCKARGVFTGLGSGRGAEDLYGSGWGMSIGFRCAQPNLLTPCAA